MEYTIRFEGKIKKLAEDDCKDLDMTQTEQGYHLVHNNKNYSIRDVLCDPDRGLVSMRIDGKLYKMSIADEIEEGVAALGAGRMLGERREYLAAPMPGLVLEVLVEKGQEIEKGQPLVVLQAMKMENLLKASFPATVSDVLVEAQEKVEKDQKLILFDLNG